MKAALLVVFAIQIHGAAASSKKIVSVDKLTPHEIEEELQVHASISYYSMVHCLRYNQSLEAFLSTFTLIYLHMP